MAARMYRSLPHFVAGLQRARDASKEYPFYSVLLYTPTNGLDERIAGYTGSRYSYLNRLTGQQCLLFVLEDVDRGQNIRDFRPEDVYEIARYLGASVDNIPCIILFTDPATRRETIVLPLRRVFVSPDDATDERLTTFFRALQAVIDKCAQETGDRLACLRRGIEKEWSKSSAWPEFIGKVSSVRDWVVASVSAGSTVMASLSAIMKVIKAFGG